LVHSTFLLDMTFLGDVLAGQLAFESSMSHTYS
jgi:hypothetical protein